MEGKLQCYSNIINLHASILVFHDIKEIPTPLPIHEFHDNLNVGAGEHESWYKSKRIEHCSLQVYLASAHIKLFVVNN